VWSELQQHGVTVLGISPDSIESHIKFAQEQSLPYLLLADVGGEVAQRYGVWVEKSRDGERYMGNARTTFYIRSDGTIGYVWERVIPNGHGQEVRDYLRGLQGSG
jgi:peroxiredoxin Q/BCP